MGIDPGTNATGYAIIEVTGREVKCLVMGFIDLRKLKDPYLKLGHIFERVGAIIDGYHPTEAAFESPFFGTNVQSMLKLGRAQGVAMAAALSRGVSVFEYAPRKIKISVTGTGTASKEQVASLLQKILKLEMLPKNLDSTDGLAVAMCHYYAENSIIKGSGKTDWKTFLNQNPERVLGTKRVTKTTRKKHEDEGNKEE